jgi:hypothetical protein
MNQLDHLGFHLLSPTSRARHLFIDFFLGLAPQALCFRALRALSGQSLARGGFHNE